MTKSIIKPISDIVDALTEHGCHNLTAELDSALSAAQPLLRGGFGDVYRVVVVPQAPVAVKALRVPIETDDEPGKIPKRAARELHTWSKCSHPNVLPLLGLAVFQDQIRMVSLWMENGSLPSYLEQNPGIDRDQMVQCSNLVHINLVNDQAYQCLKICHGLQYLHDEVPMIHGDMKGQNVLVSNEGTPMITDFGNAILQYGDLQFTQTKNIAGFTPRWTASSQGEVHVVPAHMLN